MANNVTQDEYDRAHEAWQDHYDGENFESTMRHCLAAAFAERDAKAVPATRVSVVKEGETPEQSAAYGMRDYIIDELLEHPFDTIEVRELVDRINAIDYAGEIQPWLNAAPPPSPQQAPIEDKALIDHSGSEESRELCECPKCGRSHWKLGDPPWATQQAPKKGKRKTRK